ncbi:MAG: phosphate uptake regulator PhoU [Euryarchaeota archaeon]|nr:phosphate uptake regulator PhoU [Euryarchaeota archaeon]
MKIRKLQLVGKSSFTITLPKEWITENNLRPGDSLNITKEEDGSLKLLPVALLEKKPIIEKSFNIEDLKPGMLKELIQACYHIGYDLIKIKSGKKISFDRIKEIDNVVNAYHGLAILEEKADSLTIQSLIDPLKFSLRPLVRRLGSILSLMFDEIYSALEKKDVSSMEGISHQLQEARKIYSLLLRQLIAGVKNKEIALKIGLKDVIQCLGYRIVIKASLKMIENIEIISKDAKELLTIKTEESLRKKLLSFILRMKEMHEKSLDALFKEDLNLAIEVHRLHDAFRLELNKLDPLAIKNSKVAVSTKSFCDGLNRVNDYMLDLVEVAVNRYVQHNY